MRVLDFVVGYGAHLILVALTLFLLNSVQAGTNTIGYNYTPMYNYGYTHIQQFPDIPEIKGHISVGIPIAIVGDYHKTEGLYVAIDSGNSSFRWFDLDFFSTIDYTVMYGYAVGLYKRSERLSVETILRQGKSETRAYRRNMSFSEDGTYYGLQANVTLDNTLGVVYDHLVHNGDNQVNVGVFYKINENVEFAYRQESVLDGKILESNMLILNMRY